MTTVDSSTMTFDIATAYAQNYSDANKLAAIATLQTLMQFLAEDTSNTVTELSHSIRSAINILK